MNPADEDGAKLVPTERSSAGAAAGPGDKLDEELRATLKELQRTSPQQKPAEDVQSLLLRISHHLDQEASERNSLYDRLGAIEDKLKRRGSRRFARFLLAICIGVAATLAWQSYGEEAKQIIATKAPELGWSPEAKQMIASWVHEFGWTKSPTAVRPSALETPQAAPVVQTAPEPVASKVPAAPSLDPEQMQQLTRSLTTLQQTVLQLAAGQDRMAREMARLEADLVDILLKTPERRERQ
jgi:hypothetical protein